MDSVIRAVVIYAAVWLIFRFSGRRTLAELTSFDFVLLLIVSEGVQQGLLSDDFSLTNAILVVLTLVGIDLVLSLLKQRYPKFERALDGVPATLFSRGRMVEASLSHERIDEHDILDAARKIHGIERLEDIKLAILERNGQISIIPADPKPLS